MRTVNQRTFSHSLLKDQIKMHQIIQGQTAESILDPLLSEKEVAPEHRPFVPIAYQAVARLLKYMEPLRLKLIQHNCLGAIEAELQRNWHLNSDNHPQDKASDACLIFDCEIDDEGVVTKKVWFDPDDLRSSEDGEIYDINDLKLQNAVDAANSSYVFQALKLRLAVANSAFLAASNWSEQDD